MAEMLTAPVLPRRGRGGQARHTAASVMACISARDNKKMGHDGIVAHWRFHHV